MSAVAAILSGYRALPSVDVRFLWGGRGGVRFLVTRVVSISKWDTFEKATFVLLPNLTAEGEEDFSNELPSSSSSLPSSASSSSSSSSDRPHSHGVNLRLEVAAPHYHEDQLQVKVYWKMSQHGELFYWTSKKEGNKEADLRPGVEEP